MFENIYFEEFDTEIYRVDSLLTVLEFGSLIQELFLLELQQVRKVSIDFSAI